MILASYDMDSSSAMSKYLRVWRSTRPFRPVASVKTDQRTNAEIAHGK